MLALVLTCASLVWAATYNVNPGGNWNAYKTSLLPGDILTLKPQTPGVPYTYTVSNANRFVLQGSPTQPIIVQGAPGESITMEMDACQNAVELQGRYFLFQNLILTVTANAPGAIGLRLVPNVSHAVINKITIHDIPETAFTANTGGALYDNVTFSNCEAYNVGGTGECFYVGCANPLQTTYNCQFINGFLINNYCHDTCVPDACTGGSLGSGYQVKGWGSYNNVLRNNVCARVSQVCILLYDDFDLGPNIVEGNFIYGSVMDAGIQVSAGAIIRNNVIVNNQGGIVVTTNPQNLYPGKGNRKIQISGNTLINNGGTGIDIPGLSPATGSRVVNNIVVQDSGVAFNARAAQTGVSWVKNAFHGGAAPAGVTGQIALGASSTVFQNVGAYNYHPKAGTAVLAAGTALSGNDLTFDYACVTRNSATPTIGAYELTTGSALALGFQAQCSVGGSSAPTAGTTLAPSLAPSRPPSRAPSRVPSTSAPTVAVTLAPTRTPTLAPTLACAGINCGSHGACVEPNPVCVCTDSYTGPRCENAPPDPCVGNPPAVNCGAHGTCSAGICTCRDGWTGTLCATAPPPTCTDGVQNSDEAGIDCGGATAMCPACPTFYWSPNPWGNCSKPCGSGTRNRTVDCISSATETVTTVDKCAGTPHDFVTSEACNVDPCPTYAWRSGGWDNCSQPCGVGFQSRTVECISSAGNVSVPDNFCTGNKPTTTQNCNTPDCVAPHWVTGVWDACSRPCGGGTQSRSRQCFDRDDLPVADGMCAPPIPAISQTCNLDACVNYNWKACPTFYPCTAQCNGGGAMVGNQYRDVFCIQDSDNSAVDEALCDNTTKPTILLSVCNPQPCTSANWMANSNFGPCTLQPTGVYQRFRTFHCHAADGAIAPLKDCEAIKQPISVLPCTLGTCASPDGCPVVETADVFNQCDTRQLLACSPASQCAGAAKLLEAQLKSLNIVTTAAKKCVNDYVNSLPATDRPPADLLTYVSDKVLAGEPMCVGSVSGAVGLAPSAAVFVLLLAKFF